MAVPGVAPLVISQILYMIPFFLVNLCAVSSITYSTFNGLQNQPLNLISALKSILNSFFPLLATMLVVQVIMGLFGAAFFVLMILASKGLALLGFEVDFGHELVLVILIAALLVGLLIYLQVGWYLMNAVVVLESKWGFAPLKRSWYLVKGVRGVIFLTILVFGVPSVLLSKWIFNVVIGAGELDWWIALQMVVFVILSTLLQLYGLAANAVVFAHCKALKEESVFQIDDAFGVVYVQLPSDAGNAV